MAELFSKITSFPKEWLKAVEKQAMSPPPDDIILKELITERSFKFFDALGFYEEWNSILQAYRFRDKKVHSRCLGAL